MSPDVDRRAILGWAGAAVLLQGCGHSRTPADANAVGDGFAFLTPEEAACLEAAGEIMLPGARDAGIAHYVDTQLGRTIEEGLLFARYLDLAQPLTAFYREGLAALDHIATRKGAQAFHALGKDAAERIVRSMPSDVLEGWSGPSAPLVYTAIRNDAIDVVYGGPEGVEKLGIPMMQHAHAPKAW